MLESHFLQCWLSGCTYLVGTCDSEHQDHDMQLTKVSKTRICRDLRFSQDTPLNFVRVCYFRQLLNDTEFLSLRFNRQWSFLSFPIPIFLISNEVWWWKIKVHHKFLSVQGRSVSFHLFSTLWFQTQLLLRAVGGWPLCVRRRPGPWQAPMCAGWVLNHLARQLPSSGASLRHKFLVCRIAEAVRYNSLKTS